MELMIVMAGGALGAAFRYWLGIQAALRWGTSFPYGTLLVNGIGCFIIGVFMTLTAEFFAISSHWRLLISVGFLGALTTFSSFAYETLYLVQTEQIGSAFLNVGLNLIGGFFLAWLGAVCARLMW